MEELQRLIDSDWTEDEYNRIAEKIAGVTVVEAPSVPTQTMAVVEPFNRASNLYDNRLFFPPVVNLGSQYLPLITPTTLTLGGNILNVKFSEEELIKVIAATEEVVLIKCNFGTLIYPGYIPPVKKPKKKSTTRKKQGDGNSMCSQMSFHVRTFMQEFQRVDGVLIVPTETPVYKIKVFRNGYTQVPGAHHAILEDILRAMDAVLALLNRYLHPDEPAQAKLAKCINLNPIMYNYKSNLVVPPGRYFDRYALLRGVLGAKYADEYPPLLTSKCSQKEPKVSFKFTKTVDGIAKEPLFVFYNSGRFNIQGAADVEKTTQVCQFLLRVIHDNAEEIFPAPKRPIDYLEDNVAAIDWF